jgi:sporulation protein YhbH
VAQKIESDARRFREIVRGKIKKELRKYMVRGELIARQGKDTVSVPLPQIQLPRFRYGSQEQGGVGQGEGEPGEALNQGQGKEQEGPGKAGEQPGEHALEVDVPLEELAKILGEELALPNIEPKGKKAITARKDRYSSVRRTGPESLRQFKRTFVNALKRQIATGSYDPDNPIIMPEREDRRYRSWKTQLEPESNAVIIYMMDVSGSMGAEQKEIVRIESFWIDTWLRSQYSSLESIYIIHDAVAKEVDQQTFFHVRESGGTKISSAYELCIKVMKERYPSEDWNIYPFHFSDGDNWCNDDTKLCLEMLRKEIMPAANVFCYGQVKSAYGSGQFIKDLRGAFGSDSKLKEKLILSEIDSRDQIYDSIREFLGKGR